MISKFENLLIFITDQYIIKLLEHLSHKKKNYFKFVKYYRFVMNIIYCAVVVE